MTGYSDSINHALAFAAKHHDQQVRKGLRLPYGTRPANVAMILTRYQRDEITVVAGILRNAAADLHSEGLSQEQLQRRIGDKFGAEVLQTLLSITERREDSDGVGLSADERREDLLSRLGSADERARWVLAADTLHTVGSVLADLRRTEFAEAAWARYPSGRESTLSWFRSVAARLDQVGFDAPIMRELRETTDALDEL